MRPIYSFVLLRGGQRKIYIKRSKAAHCFCGNCGTPIYAAAISNGETYSLRVGGIKQRTEFRSRRQILVPLWTALVNGFERHRKARPPERPGPRLGMPNNRKNSPNKRRKQHGGNRGPKKQLGDKPGASFERNMEDATATLPSPTPKAKVSFFITQAQKVELRERGYSDDQIAQMKPAEAHQILGLE